VPFGAVVNHLTVGFEATRTIYDYVNNLQTGQTIDIFNPVYGTLSPTLTPYGHGQITADDTSASISDLIDVTSRINVLLSARDDITGGGSDDYLAGNSQRVNGRRATPRFGVVYKATTLDSLYASYEQGIAPQVGIAKDGTAFVPNVADEVEIGYRRSGPGFSATVAAYHLLINNLLTPDPTDPIYRCNRVSSRAEASKSTSARGRSAASRSPERTRSPMPRSRVTMCCRTVRASSAPH
jgi:iron complex outermembrane receptor protein